MATTLHMQLPSAPNRSLSFDQPRSRSTPPFSSNHDTQTSPMIPRANTPSNSFNAVPYHHSLPTSYIPPPHPMDSAQSQAWSTTALPASAFYPSHLQQYPNQQVFQQGFQQPHSDLSAWTTAYQQYVMASAVNGSRLEHQGERRRPDSGPQPYHHVVPPAATYHQSTSNTPPPFHLYKRDNSHEPSWENTKMSRSTSQPTLSSTLDHLSPSSSMPSTRTPTSSSDHQRSSSNDSAFGSVKSCPDAEYKKNPIPPHTPAQQTSFSSTFPSKAAPLTPTIKMITPLLEGPIAAATNSLPPTSARFSPLFQSPMSPSPEPTEKMMKSGGLKGRLRKALEKDSKRDGKTSAPPSPVKSSPVLTPQPVHTSPSETSTRSATPPTTPSQNFSNPSPPFVNTAAMASEISLATTERTAIAPSEMTNDKTKRSLFRMKNMSTDNISLASTVSSASMMIRKMGSIGKLARRNSLMGISRIFKDKPKDEDASLPEKEVKKKEKKGRKSKSEIAPAAISHAIVEAEDERAFAGLSPAAKLARQHTLRSKAEAEAEEAKKEVATTTATVSVTQSQQLLPSIASISGPEVLHVTARPAPTIVHAVAVSEHEYDSADDSSDGETVDDVTVGMGRSRLSDEADADFQATWGNAYIDRYAVPKKGILKSMYSVEDLGTSTSISIQSRFPARQVGFYEAVTPPQSGDLQASFVYQHPAHNTSAPSLQLGTIKPATPRSMTAPPRRRILWAPECAVYSTYDAATYDRRSEPATCNRLTPELAMVIKQELNAFKLEMPVHPASKAHTHYFA